MIMHFSSLAFSVLVILSTLATAMPTPSNKAMTIRTTNDAPKNLDPRATTDTKTVEPASKEDPDSGSDSDSTIKPIREQAKKEESQQSMGPPPKKQSPAYLQRTGSPVLPPVPPLRPGGKDSETELELIDRDNWSGYGDA